MPHCAVRRLQVSAASEAAARRFVTTLEDALRCATLPGGDRRVVVVRRLALGRIAQDAGTQRLGLLIEQRLARGHIAWAQADDAPTADNDVVGFAGTLEARTLLACRLVQGRACEAWYWPLAVSEFRRDQAPHESLQQIARTIAAWPEARVALPAWIVEVVAAGGGPVLCAAIDEQVGRVLLHDAGIALPGRSDDSAPERARVRARAHPRSGTATAPVRTWPTPASPAWLDAVLAMAPAGRCQRSRPDAAAQAPNDRAPETSPVVAASEAALDVPGDVGAPTAESARTPTRGPTAGRLVPPCRATAMPSPTQASAPRRVRATPSSIGDEAGWQPTACGGLLFLLPVLARAGTVAGHSPDTDRVAALQVLQAALRRVRAADDDAAWSLVADLALQPAHAAGATEDRALQALAVARRWLHRHARLGLVALVRRPARLALTATHVDVRFPLAGADVRVRRLGLDVDPGWLPWFGRVVAFQFAGRLP